MTTRTGAVANTAGSDVDERQLAAIGATRGADGWWYLNGRRLSHDEADQLVNAAGQGVAGQAAWGKPGGFRIGGDVGGLWERNKDDIAKYGGIAANFIPGVGPLAAAAIGAGLNYGAHHDPMQALVSGATNYGGGKILSGLGNTGAGQAVTGALRGVENAVPGLSSLADAGGDVSSWLGSKLGSTGKDIGASSAGQWWDKNVKQPVQGAVAGNGAGSPNNGGLSLGDILKTAGGVATGAMDYAQAEAQRKQQASQFDRSYGLQRNAQQAGLSSQLNRAPLADLGQYGATHITAPTAFQPRDYTRGLDQMTAPAAGQGGPQAQLAANQAASAKYTPGAGGVNTDTLKMLLARLQGGG